MPDVGYTFNSLIASISAMGSASANLADLSLTGTRAKTLPAVDYGQWSKHVYFADAIRKLRNSLRRVEYEYPIGLSGGDVSSLCAENIFKVDQWKKNSSGFDLWFLDQLSLTDSVTALATNQAGESVALIHVIRSATNSITGSQTSVVDSVSAQAIDFEERSIEYIPQTAGSANDHWEWAGTAETTVSRGPKLKNMLPEVLFYNDDNEYLEKTLQAMGDMLDELKTYADQLSYLKTTSYEDHDRIPNKFLPVLANHFGITLYQSAVNTALDSFIIQSSTAATTQEIAYKLWNRVVNNLIYLLKNKGTRECIEAIGRIYGVDHNFLKVDEYTQFKKRRRVKVPEEVDVPILFSTGDVHVQMPTLTNTVFDYDEGQNFTIEMRISATSARFHRLLVHPMYSIQLDSLGRVGFVCTAGTTAYTAQSSISSFVQTRDNFVNVIASRTGDNLKVWLACLSGSGSGGDDVVVLASGITSGVQSLNYDSSAGAGSFGTYFPGSGSFTGYIHEVRVWNTALVEEDLKEHVRNFESISFINSTASPYSVGYGSLKAHYKLKEDVILTGGYNYIVDSTTGSNTAIARAFSNQTTKRYRVFSNVPKFSYWYPAALSPDNDKIRQSTDDEKYVKDPGTLSMHLTPINAVNRDFRNVVQDLNIKEMMGDPAELYLKSYSGKFHETLLDLTTRYNGKTLVDVNTFIDAMDNFNDVLGGIFKFSEQFLPAKSNLLSQGILIEPHIFERPKIERAEYDVEKISPTARYINTHYLELDSTAASGATTASFQRYRYEGLQTTITNSLSAEQAIPSLSNTKGNSTNVPRFSDTRIGRYVPVKVTPDNPADTSIDLTVSRILISPTASPSAFNGFIDGTLRLLRGGKVFNSSVPALKFTFPASADGTNLFSAEIGDIDNGKGRVIEGKDLEFTTKFDLSKMQMKLKLADIVKSATSDTNTLSGEIGVVNINITNLFSNSTQVLRVAIGNRQELFNELAGQGGVKVQS